jgi:hypothetical protein
MAALADGDALWLAEPPPATVAGAAAHPARARAADAKKAATMRRFDRMEFLSS